MVQTLVTGLPAHGIEVHHVNLGLSRDAADIGRWRPGKIAAVLDACRHAVAARFRHGCDTFYYVPAPGKRGALYRDWVVMLLCRPFFKRLVLHWHAPGLGEWLDTRATAPERALTQLLLGRAELSIVLAESLRGDAAKLRARKIAVVANGIADPLPPDRQSRNDKTPFEILFLGLCDEAKGLFTLAAAVLEANRQVGADCFRLTAAGAFPDPATAQRFAARAEKNPRVVRHLGFVNGEAKQKLLRESDCLGLPTRFPNEGQPLVLLEAMAYDLPVIATRWRAIPATVPPEAILVEPGDGEALAGALVQFRNNPPPAGVFRRHFLTHFTDEQHLRALSGALSSFDQPPALT